MTPYKFTRTDETEFFHYKFSELREFIALGKDTGATGMIIMQRDSRFTKYKGFGTIENPRHHMISFYFQPMPIMGEPATAEEICKPKEFPYKFLGWVFPK